MKVRYVQRVRRDDGRTDLYFRKGGVRRGPLKSADGTFELEAEVQAILAEMKQALAAAEPVVGTVGGALKKYNRSSEFITLERSTQRDYQYKINELAADCGDVLLEHVTYDWLKALQDAWAPRGHKITNDLMQVLKNALKPQMANGSVKGHPFASINKLQPPANKGEAHPAWTDAEVDAAIDIALKTSQPGLARAIALGRWGGFRRGGICRIPLHARIVAETEDGTSHRRLFWTTPKRGVQCDKPEDERLAALIERTPNRALSIAYNKYGQPWKERALNQAFDRLIARMALADRGRPDLDIHGLRHARGMELAHAGASEFQIMAQLEHATPYTARIYIRQANRAKGADDAQTLIDNRNRRRMARKAP
jgi:hypothetical protein